MPEFTVKLLVAIWITGIVAFIFGILAIVYTSYYVPELYAQNNYISSPCNGTGHYIVETSECGSKSKYSCYEPACEVEFNLPGHVNASDFLIPNGMYSRDWISANATGEIWCAPTSYICWYDPNNPDGTFDIYGNLIPNVRLSKPDAYQYFVIVVTFWTIASSFCLSAICVVFGTFIWDKAPTGMLTVTLV